jgi:hypothetical protein
MQTIDVDFGQYVTARDYGGIAFWVDNWVKDIKEEYAKKTAQGLFAFVGLDLLFGW